MVSRGKPCQSRRGNRLGCSDFSRLQKVVISRRIQPNIAHASRVRQYVIQVPQIDSRNVPRQDLLNFEVKTLADTLVGFSARLIDQVVETQIGIKSAISPHGRKVARMESGVKDVGIFVSPDPTQRVKLESAARDVGKKRGKFIGAYVERDPHIAQLLLQDGSQ